MYNDSDLNRIISVASNLQNFYYTETEVVQVLEELGVDSIRARHAIELVEQDEFELADLIEQDKPTVSGLDNIIVRIVTALLVSAVICGFCGISFYMIGKMTPEASFDEKQELLNLKLELLEMQRKDAEER